MPRTYSRKALVHPHELDRLEQEPMDDQLRQFLAQWISTRLAQAEKYRLKAEKFQHRNCRDIYEKDAYRAYRHYGHEVRMLRELADRSLSPVDVSLLPFADPETVSDPRE